MGRTATKSTTISSEKHDSKVLPLVFAAAPVIWFSTLMSLVIITWKRFGHIPTLMSPSPRVLQMDEIIFTLLGTMPIAALSLFGIPFLAIRGQKEFSTAALSIYILSIACAAFLIGYDRGSLIFWLID